VLLPAGFPLLDSCVRDAILAHECLHVRRRDWLFTVVEELVRAVFWFHPAIWWLLGEIQLAREQAVDRAAVEMTQQREEYVDALLAIAGARPQLDLAPAPLFLRKRHLKQRVISIVKEVRMSKTGLASALAVGVCLLAAACWMVTSAFPLEAAPQTVTDGAGVSVDIGAATLMHRTGVAYPQAALAKGIEGTVVVQARLDAGGNVVDASVISGPQELRRAALQAVLQWHFAREYGGGARQVSIEFKLPKAATLPAAAANSPPGEPTVRLANGADPAQVQALIQQMRQRVEIAAMAPQATPGVLGSIPSSRADSVPFPPPSRIKSITVIGLPQSAQSELLASLPVKEGDLLTVENQGRILAAARQYDEHLSVTPSFDASGGQVDVQISTPGAIPPRIRVGGNVQAVNLVKKVQPVYPPLAKQARIQGTVVLTVIIGKDGKIQNVTVDSGHALLIQSALDAVRQWEYRPTLLNAEPVEVSTQVEINFTLAEDPPPAQQ
jgi:TonB family protein